MKHVKIKSAVALVIFVAALFVLTFIASEASAATVPEGHVGIVLRRGRADDDILSPGKYWTNPFTTDIVLMDTRWQKYSAQTSAFSKDIQQVDIIVSMSYQIENGGALRIYKEVGLDYADKIMLPRLLDALKSTFAKYSAEDLISRREQISGEVLEMLSEQLEFYRVEVREIAIEDIDFTDAFTNAIEAKQVATQTLLQAQTEQEQQTLIAQAEAERAKIKTEAEANQKIITAQAEADAIKIRADAEAYRLEMESKHITDLTIRKQLIEKWNGSLPMISGDEATPIIDVNNMLNSTN